MPRFAANLSFLFAELPFLDRFAAAARAGFDAVEFHFPYDYPAADVARAARAADVEIALFNAPPGDLAAGDFGLAALAGREKEFEASLLQGLDYAAVLNCTRLHVLAGIANAGGKASLDTYRANLAAACALAADRGVHVLIEPINGRSVPGYFLDSFTVAELVLDELAHPHLRLLFDIFHRQILHGDVSFALERLLPRIGHAQVAAVPHRHEPGSGELAEGVFWPLLDRLGYAGLVGAEYLPANTTEAGLGWFKPFRRR